jgi:hypothetical protein
VSEGFPGLGFDPTPGNVGSVQAAVDALGRAGLVLGPALERLVEAIDVANDWEGEAANDFVAHADDLPEGLIQGGEAIVTVAKALMTWLDQLSTNKSVAELYEKAAVVYRRQLATADKAQRDEARARLEQVIRQAQRLADRHERQANAAADAIDGAPQGSAFEVDEDSVTDQVLDGVATVSGEIATWSDTLAAATVWVPPVSAAAALTARAANGVNLTTGLLQIVADTKGKREPLELFLGNLPGGSKVKKFGGLIRTARGTGPAAAKARRELHDALGKELKDKMKHTAPKDLRQDRLERGRDLAGPDAKHYTPDELRDLARAKEYENLATKALGLPADIDGTRRTLDGDSSPPNQNLQNGKYLGGILADPFKGTGGLFAGELQDSRAAGDERERKNILRDLAELDDRRGRDN